MKPYQKKELSKEDIIEQMKKIQTLEKWVKMEHRERCEYKLILDGEQY